MGIVYQTTIQISQIDFPFLTSYIGFVIDTLYFSADTGAQ